MQGTEVTAPDGRRFTSVQDMTACVVRYRPEDGYKLREVTGHAVTEEDYMAAIEQAQAGVCSHGGHGWDGETCSDIPVVYMGSAECWATCGPVSCTNPDHGYPPNPLADWSDAGCECRLGPDCPRPGRC